MSDVPFAVTEPITMGDISDQEGGGVIDPVSRVKFIIKKCGIQKKETKEGDWTFTQLNPTFTVGSEGLDGEGKGKNMHFFGWKNLNFPGLLLDYNKERYTTDWWNKQARYQTKMFLIALGFDPKSPPAISDEFCMEITGREVQADISNAEITEKVEGKYVGTGERINYLTNFKAV